jgi:hypothetical protein
MNHMLIPQQFWCLVFAFVYCHQHFDAQFQCSCMFQQDEAGEFSSAPSLFATLVCVPVHYLIVFPIPRICEPKNIWLVIHYIKYVGLVVKYI